MWFIRNLKFRLLYHYRAFIYFIGYCPYCWSKINYTTKGRAVCNNINCKK